VRKGNIFGRKPAAVRDGDIFGDCIVSFIGSQPVWGHISVAN